MAEYRFYKIIDTGKIEEPPVTDECGNDLSAIKEASKLLDRVDIKILEGERLLAYLVPESFAVDKSR